MLVCQGEWVRLRKIEIKQIKDDKYIQQQYVDQNPRRKCSVGARHTEQI